jgi:hypothetical protein
VNVTLEPVTIDNVETLLEMEMRARAVASATTTAR